MSGNSILQRRPTQQSIASALGLSQSAVTVALSKNPEGKLSGETVARIREYAARVGYRPNRVAQVMRSGRSHTIGVVYRAGEFVYHAQQERIKHLARCALRAGYQVISIDMDWFEGNIAAAQDYLLGVATEGIILCNISAGDQAGWLEFAQKGALPVLSMISVSNVGNQVRSDMRAAFRDMTRHHLEHGARKPCLLLPFHDAVSMESLRGSRLSERVEGFLDAIRTAGGEVIADAATARIFHLPVEFSSRRPAIEAQVCYPLRTELYENVFDVGYYETLRLLQGARNRPDSLVCSNDDIGVGAMAACVELGLRIPEDIRISGADNAPFARYCGIPLTTIEQPAQCLSEWSIRRIVELIEHPEQRLLPQEKCFPCELIFRKSTTGVGNKQYISKEEAYHEK